MRGGPSVKRSKHPEYTALAWAALAAIRRDQEAAAAETEERRDDGEDGEEVVALRA